MPEGTAPQAGGVFSVDGMITEAGGDGGGDRWVMRRLVEARPAGGRGGEGAQEGAGVREAETGAGEGEPAGARILDPVEALLGVMRTAGGAGATWELVKAGAGDLLAGVVPMVFLKQFRDIADPSRACYQAIVEAAVRRVGPVRGGGVLKRRYELAVHDHPGFPLASRLGLAGRRAGGEVVVPVPTPLWLEFDYVLDTGRVAWQASGAPPARWTEVA